MPDPTPALLLVDVIRAFFDRAGLWWYPEVSEVTAPLEKLLAAARADDLPVIHAAQRHPPRPRGPALPRGAPRERPFDRADGEPAPGFEPQPGRAAETLLPKSQDSAFFATGLDTLLRANGVDTLVIAGVKTNVCVRATIQDAFAHGYRVVVPREATNSNRPHLAAATLEDVEHYFGEVVNLDEALRRL